MKFLAGVMAGMLMAGPTVEHHYHLTETNRFRLEQPDQAPAVYEVRNPWQPVDGSEQCVIDLLGGPTAGWDADDVIAVLDEAWREGVSPCELEEMP